MSPLRAVGAACAAAVLVVVVAWAVAPALFTSYDPIRGVVADRLQPPGGAHLLGTDELGRDVLSRVVHGASLSLRAATVAVVVALVIGMTVGLLAGTGGRLIDDVLMRVVDVMLAIPSFLLVLAIVIAIGFGTTNVAIAVGISASASFSRIMRSEVVRIRGAGYVEASRVSGTRPLATVVRHVLPNSTTPVLALATLELGNAVLTVAALSFLGFGASPPTPEWGSMIADGHDFLSTAWWLTTCPGLVIVAVVMATNHLGHLVRDSRSGR